MELTLVRQTGSEVLVICDSKPSHRFDLLTLVPREASLSQSLEDSVTYGRAIYGALFPAKTLALQTLAGAPERILLITTDNDLDAVPWEYAYGPYGSEDSDSYLVCNCCFARGLPVEQRLPPPSLQDTSLHIIAVPSDPLSHELEPLDIDGEWMRLKEIIQRVPYTITLERTRPPTIEQVRTLVMNQRHRVVHFMGHGEQDKQETFLYFEKENGELDPVTARQFVLRMRGSVFLVTLNACVTATPGPTRFSNLAAALVRQKIPYALGMRFSVPDDDAQSFSRAFYSDLAHGSSVEEALLQARLTLAKRSRPWLVGMPVLYTSLAEAAAGFAPLAGFPIIKEHQSRIEAGALQPAEGAFQGRIDELQALGTVLTGNNRPSLITVHGAGGQGKTTLVREAIERFAYAWPGGVWSAFLGNLPGRELFISNLARFLEIDTQKVIDLDDLERLVIAQLADRRTLIVLDNAETLVEAVEANREEARQLAEFLRERLPRPPVSLLVTSRSYLGWSGEAGLELEGLSAKEGAELFQQNVSRLIDKEEQVLAWDLSQKVGGHPLSLRLLAGAFNASKSTLSEFVEEYERHLLVAENKYKEVDHRHRSLYASIETSISQLDIELYRLFSGLWVFHAPFSPDRAAAIFDPDSERDESRQAVIFEQLQTLWHRGLLLMETNEIGDQLMGIYRLLPTIRHFIEEYVEQSFDRDALLARFGKEYAQLASVLHANLQYDLVAAFMAQRLFEDLDRGVQYVDGEEKAVYLLDWSWLLHRLGYIQQGLRLAEQALEIVEGENQSLEGRAFHEMAQIFYTLGQARQALALSEKSLAIVQKMKEPENEANIRSFRGLLYRDLGQPRQALASYEQALSLLPEGSDQNLMAVTLNNMALVYDDMGQLKEALALYERALPLVRERGNLAEEVNILDNMANVYRITGKMEGALELSEQALATRRKMGDRDGEAASMHSIALIYESQGRPQEALALNEQVLQIRYELQDRKGEATTLNNMILSYLRLGQSKQALMLAEQALPIAREVGDRSNEATLLHGMAKAYFQLGQLKQALALYEQALVINREVEDRRSEASVLSSMVQLYVLMGQPEQASKLAEQVLPIMREMGDRRGEAIALNDLARVYDATGQLNKALALYEQGLAIFRDVGDRANETVTLQNIATIYKDLGEPQKALELAEEALVSVREVGDRAKESTILNSMAAINRVLGRQQQALALYEQALRIRIEVEDRVGEATTLNNIARLHLESMNYQQALALFEESLAISREVGDRPHQAVVLNNMARLHMDLGEPEQALELLEQSLSIRREVGNRMGEATTLANMAAILDHFGRSQEAITCMEQAIAILVEANLPQDAAGQTVDELRQSLETMRRRAKQRAAGDGLSASSAAEGQQPTADDGEVSQGGEPSHDDDLPFNAELIPRSVIALLSGPEERREHAQYLNTMSAQTTDEELKALIEVIHMALFGGNISSLGQNLQGDYKRAWQTIAAFVESGGVDPRLFEWLIHNTRAVLGPAAGKRSEWRDQLLRLKSQAPTGNAHELTMLLDAIIAMLDAEGKSSGLGSDLTGIYARTWQEIVEHL